MNIVPDESDDDVLAHISPELLAQLDEPPAQWLAELTNEALPAVRVPREEMWTAIEKRRRRSRFSWPRTNTMIGIAATLIVGVAIGRFALPHTVVANGNADTASASQARAATNAPSNAQSSTAPLAIAVAEHLSRTEALLTTVRLDGSAASTTADIANWAGDLLGTTRLLIDDPSMHDVKMRHLLQDLELVLTQVVQARANSAPLVRGAPAETLRETNLLPRVRAATAAAHATNAISYSGGISE